MASIPIRVDATNRPASVDRQTWHVHVYLSASALSRTFRGAASYSEAKRYAVEMLDAGHVVEMLSIGET